MNTTKTNDLAIIAQWLIGDDTGMSSEFIAAVAIAGTTLKPKRGDTAPHDAPDLGRCVRLIEKAPSVRECFPNLRQTSPVWAVYVDYWGELTELYLKGNYRETTEMMGGLRLLANSVAKSLTKTTATKLES